MQKILYTFCTFLFFFLLAAGLFAQSREVVDRQNEAAFQLYQAIKKTQPDTRNTNFIFSPSCVAHAMSLAYVGARGQSANQIATALGFPKDTTQLARTFNSLNASSLQTASSAWVSAKLRLTDHYQQTVRTAFRSHVATVDFSASNTVPLVNKWFYEKTNGKIPHFVDSFDPQTMLFLGSAIHFKADWKQPFRKNDTKNAPFTTLNGQTQLLPMMFQNGEGRVAYGEYNRCQVIEMPYDKVDQSIVVVLPQQGTPLEDIEKQVYNTILLPWPSKKGFPNNIRIFLPKFDTKAKVELNSALQAMGIVDAFSESADFSGMTASSRLYISRVFHEATITLDEKGTEATAATGVGMPYIISAMPTPTIEFCANRPFMYVIKDNRSGLVLFIGSFVKQ